MDVDVISSNRFIQRPPPLDPKVERDLRDACEVILRDLKPSGHDIEDRRMKTDILVEGDPFKLNHRVKSTAQNDAGKPKRQHSAASWIIDGDTDEQHTSSNTRDSEKPAQNPAKPPTIVKKSDVRRQDPNQLLANEGPLAPRPTDTQTTRQPSVPTSSHVASSPHPAQRTDSTSTDVSTPFTPSTEHYKSASTAPSSAAMTSADSSNRASESIYIQPATAKDEQWMKYEVEKHRQSQGPILSNANADGTTILRGSHGSDKTTALKDRRGSQDAQSINLSSKSGIDANKRPTITSRSSSRQSGAFAGAAQPVSPPLTSPTVGRPGSSSSVSSKRHSRSGHRSSLDGIHETRHSPQPSPQNEDVPPVPRLDAERLNSLTNASRDNSNAQAAGAEVQNQHVDKSRANVSHPHGTVTPQHHVRSTTASHLNTQTTTEPHQPSNPSDATQATSVSAVADSRHPNTNTPVINPQHATKSASNPHSQDRSILVRDFSQQSQLSSYFRRSTNDPSPADFDALMSAMDSAVHAPVGQQPSPLLIGDPSSPSRSNLMLPKDVVSRSSSNYSSHSGKAGPSKVQGPSTARGQPTQPETSARTSQPNSGKVTQHVQIKRPKSTSMVNGISASQAPTTFPTSIQQSNPTSVTPPAGFSEVNSNRSSTLTSRKEKKGLSRLMWRLGGGDMPERRSTHISPHQSQQIQVGDEYEFNEEEACAAPVIGFGRGW